MFFKAQSLPLDEFIDQSDHPVGKTETVTNRTDGRPLMIDKAQLQKVPLVPVNCSFGIVTENPDNKISLRSVAKKQRRVAGTDITLVFAIRTPCCMGCREHGLQLSDLVKEKNVAAIGVIKETGIDGDTLLNYYQDYFRFPLYRDLRWKIFQAMGSRRIMPWRMKMVTPRMTRRLHSKNIESATLEGDVVTQGGVMIFDKKGDLRYVYQENYGEPLNVIKLGEAIEAVRISQSSQTSESLDDTESSVAFDD